MRSLRVKIPLLVLVLGLFCAYPSFQSSAQGPHSVTLTWNAPTSGGPPTSYLILRGTSTGTETQIATVPAPTLTYVDTTGVGGTAYFYEIKASNATGTSAASNEVSATFLLDLPGAPAGLKAVSN